MSQIEANYEQHIELVRKVYLYEQNKDAFKSEIDRFDENSVQAYIVLVSHFKQQQQKVPVDLQRLMTPEHFFDKLNGANKQLANDKLLSKHLVDAFEIMLTVTDHLKDDQFYKVYHAYLQNALLSEKSMVISVYLQILHRLNRVFNTQTPVDILKSVIAAVHGPLSDKKLLNEALLLVESSMELRFKRDGNMLENENLLQFIWHNLCLKSITKHQCDNCYSIISQLIKIYLEECKRNDSFRVRFLSEELWDFIRVAIESKEMTRRKKAIYILQNVLESNQSDVMSNWEPTNESTDDLQNIWKNYFAVLESLLEIQCHLILSCLKQYLDGVVKHLPASWYSIVFTLVLKHHNNVVIHHGIEYILKHRISLQHNSHLMDGFYQAINNTYLHAEAKICEKLLAAYFQDSDMNHTLAIMQLVNWQPVPLWTMIKSLQLFVQMTNGNGFQTGSLLDFLKRSLRVVKHMPEISSITVNILQNLHSHELQLEHILGLYDIIPNEDIFKVYQQPFDLYKFEHNFIQLNQVSIDSKIKYFEYAVPTIADQSKMLDAFYEKKRSMIHYYPNYEFLLFKNIWKEYMENPMMDAINIMIPRLNATLKTNHTVTLETLNFAATLLKFVVKLFLDECDDSSVFDVIYKVTENLDEIIRKKKYVESHCEQVSVQDVRDKLAFISLKMTKNSQLYPQKLRVLGILVDAMQLGDENIDLSRFDPNDENDVVHIQGLYECFLDKCYDYKPSHQANVVHKILSNFHNLEHDIWKAYQILLAGKADVTCIFKQTHSYCAPKINEILSEALIHGNELKGEEKQVYDFVSSKSSTIPYNQQVRLTAMRAIVENNDLEQIRIIKDFLFTKNTENYRVRYYTNSYHHSLKLRITQAFAFLFRLDPQWDERILKMVLEEANQSNVSHINELIIAQTVEPTQLLQIISNIDGNKGLQSLFMTIFYVCCKNSSDLEYVRECIKFLIKYIFMKQIIVRTLAQIVLIRLCEKFNMIEEFEVLYNSIKAAHETKVSRALKFSYSYKYRFEQIDATKLLHSMYTLREIPRITKMVSDEYYKHELYDPEDLDMILQVNEEDNLNALESADVEMGFIDGAEDALDHPCHAGGNVQRKLVTYRETFVDRQVLNSLSDEFTRRDTKNESDLILLASLLTKASNLGGLSRSSEVFGVKALTLDNLKNLKHNDFTSISMASEKWLKFFEVKHFNVVSYLIAMKANGYTIVGAEQTAFGVELHTVQLPKKMVLVLGHEKEGIPANILNLLDMAVEVPQFGVVRSLNVHVTASLFMWEYCKQHLILDANISR